MQTDVLTDVLQTIRLDNAVYGRMLLGAPWGLRFDPEPRHGGFLVVARGGGWLESDGVGPIALAPGDFVLHHGREGMTLRDHKRTRAVPIREVFQGCPTAGVARAGGDGAITELIAGCFTWAGDPASNPLIASLPPVVHVRAEAAARLEPVLQLLGAELGGGQPGSRTVISRLADVMLVLALRAHLAAHGGECKGGGWLRAVGDPQIGAALAAIHGKPESDWTVESLAKSAAMSRSAFAARFAELVGEPPLQYVTRWRMQKAAHALRTSDARLAEIATAVGYETEASFSKAFKRVYHLAPGAFRRTAEFTAAP